jgi:hypothetical protein
MSAQQIIVPGQIQPDGTLYILKKLPLPPGPVSVIVQSNPTGARKPTLQVLQEIWAEREAQGVAGRSKADIDAEIEAMREEDEKRMREINSGNGR